MTVAHFLTVGCSFRGGDPHRWIGGWSPKRNVKKTHLGLLPPPSATGPSTPLNQLELLKTSAREKFVQEISPHPNNKAEREEKDDISLAKSLLLVAVEDEAFLARNREFDSLSRHLEMGGTSDNPPSSLHEEYQKLQALSGSGSGLEDIRILGGSSISGWMKELDRISKDVEMELESDTLSRDFIPSHLVNVFESRGFKKCPQVEEQETKFSYLHTVLASGSGTPAILGVILIEIYSRLGINLVGHRIGDDVWVWPGTWDPEELFKVSSSRTGSGSSSSSGSGSASASRLEIASKRDILSLALSNLVRTHWKRASRSHRWIRLTTPLRPGKESGPSRVPLLRPQDLRLAVMASERLLMLEPRNWVLRRDHGMLLFYCRRYGEAVQELSICMAFAPVEEVEVLEHFIERLHLLRIEATWNSSGYNSPLACL